MQGEIRENQFSYNHMSSKKKVAEPQGLNKASKPQGFRRVPKPQVFDRSPKPQVFKSQPLKRTSRPQATLVKGKPRENTRMEEFEKGCRKKVKHSNSTVIIYKKHLLKIVVNLCFCF